MGYKASLKVSCWKEHTCTACEAVFRYPMHRQVSAEAATSQAAEQAAQKQAIAALTGTVDVHPCPVCGWIQPDMIAKGQKSRYFWTLALGLAGIGIGWFPGLAHGWSLSAAAWVSLAAMGAASAALVTKAMADPNASRARHAEDAARRLEEGVLRLTSPGRGSAGSKDAFELPKSRPATFLVGLAMLGGCCALLFAAAVYPGISGATVHGNWYPAVVGPGDTATYYLADSIKSVQGYWKGPASVTVTNAAALGLAPSAGQSEVKLVAKTKASSWGTSISGKSVSESSNRMYVEVTLPPDPTLAGKSLDLAIEVKARFPKMVGSKAFTDTDQVFAAKTAVALGAPGVGGAHASLSMAAQVGSAVVLLVVVLLFNAAANGLKSKAEATDIHPME